MPVPTDPTNLAVTGRTTNSVSLSWTPGTGQTSQVVTVYDGAHNTIQQTLTLEVGLDPSESTATIGSLLNGTTYVFRLQGVNATGSSGSIEVTGATIAAVVGTYSSVTLGKRAYGSLNVVAYSDNNNTGNEDTDNEQYWLNNADDWINLAFNRVGRTTPIPSTEDDFTSIQRIATEWWVAQMAKGRGDFPEGVSNADGFDSMMDGHIERAEKALAGLVTAWQDTQDNVATGKGVFMLIPQESICQSGDENAQ